MKTKKILVIDDGKYIVSQIREVFKDKKGYKVVGPDSVTSYKQAMDLIREHKPYAIALDMSLSDGKKEGINIAEELYRGNTPSAVSVISSYSVREVADWVGGYGVKHYAGAKDAEKFAECVLGKCECHLWKEYLELEQKCAVRKTAKKLAQRILISSNSKSKLIATGKPILDQFNDREDVEVKLIEPGSLAYYLELKSGIPLRIVSDFVGDILSERMN